MASCYHCARQGADYRRNVVTGRSRGTYYGKKNTSFSTRTNSGLRSVCEDCAFSIDKSRLIQSVTIIWILAVIMIGLILYYKF